MSSVTHVGATDQLGWLRFGAEPAGLVLGRDAQRAVVPVRLFRDEPVRVALIGGAWLASLVAFRALAVGARVVVSTAAPDRWHPLVRAAQGTDRLAVLLGEQPVEVSSGWASPVLLIDDFGPAGPTRRGNLAPWQTRLTVLPRLIPAGAAVAGSATLVLAQRLTAAEATAAAELLWLSDETANLLQAQHDDMVTLIGGGADRYVWVNATAIETHLFGPPHRSG